MHEAQIFFECTWCQLFRTFRVCLSAVFSSRPLLHVGEWGVQKPPRAYFSTRRNICTIFRSSAIPQYCTIQLFFMVLHIVFVLCSRNMYNTKVLTVLISYYTIVQIILDTIIVKCRAECTVARLKSPIRFSLAVWLRQIQLDFRIFSGDVILYSLLTTYIPWYNRNVITRG